MTIFPLEDGSETYHQPCQSKEGFRAPTVAESAVSWVIVLLPLGCKHKKRNFLVDGDKSGWQFIRYTYQLLQVS
jgi:hypothetical protein